MADLRDQADRLALDGASASAFELLRRQGWDGHFSPAMYAYLVPGDYRTPESSQVEAPVFPKATWTCSFGPNGICGRLHTHIERPGRRSRPPKAIQVAILAAQQNRCLYCDEEFGSWLQYRGRATTLKIQWDHRVPFAYLDNNPHDNWVAACAGCNGAKSDKMFETLEDAQAYIRPRRFSRGWRPLPVGQTAD